jgi:hypothetical protein
MKSTLWIIIVVVSGFLGFMMGYSFPPFLQTDLSGGKLQAAPEAQKVDKDMQDYYKNLYKEDEQ